MNNLINMNSYIYDNIKTCLHKYNHYYDTIETNIDIIQNIQKNNDIILLLNNKSFQFINEINVTFKNDFDNKIYFKHLPHEMNLEIYSYLIDEKSIKINLFNLNYLYVKKIKYYIFEDEIQINVRFKLIKRYLKNMNDFENVQEFQNKIPNYLLNEYKYGINIHSLIDRQLEIKIKNMIYNNPDFLDYKNKFIETIQTETY